MTNRYSVRLGVDIRPMQLSNFMEGKGITIAVSSSGCEMTSNLSCCEGQELDIRLHVPDMEWPLRIEQTRVLRVRGNAVGLQFLHFHAGDLSKFRELVRCFGLDEARDEVELSLAS